LEAMASAVPVVASNIAGYRQVIEDGENGLLFNPYSPIDIKERILSVLSNDSLRDNLAKNGLESVKQYDWGKIADRIFEIYNKAIC